MSKTSEEIEFARGAFRDKHILITRVPVYGYSTTKFKVLVSDGQHIRDYTRLIWDITRCGRYSNANDYIIVDDFGLSMVRSISSSLESALGFPLYVSAAR